MGKYENLAKEIVGNIGGKENVISLTHCVTKAYKIEPLVTITHFDCLMDLVKEYSGWRNRKMLTFYERLCRTLFTRYKEYVHYWITFNEINMILHAPFMAAGICFEDGENEKQIMYHRRRIMSCWQVPSL
ncbi:family 1 glycosylhydrolase [Lachnospiraceae bacterium 62-35]